MTTMIPARAAAASFVFAVVAEAFAPPSAPRTPLTSSKNGPLRLSPISYGAGPFRRRRHRAGITTTNDGRLFSTPFDLDMYDNDDDDVDLDASSNPFGGDTTPDEDPYASPLAVDPSTKLILGINKYSHDASICAADAATGRVLFATAKERISRTKHDGGNTATLVELCLDQLDLDVDAVVKVVMNNHHHRILPFMEVDPAAMEWEEGLGINGGAEEGYSDEFNLLTEVADKVEMSHHLAHAYSAAAQCPFDEGMVVVMDGMGETYRTMRRAVDTDDKTYVSDLGLCGDDVQFVPADIAEKARESYFDWREAESVYTFVKNGDGTDLCVKPVFKRFTEERTPPTLYNHGFENMDSLGAVYSRASSHIFGDWNACGKVMGLAPWYGHVWDRDEEGGTMGGTMTAGAMKEPIFEGQLYSGNEGEGMRIDRSSMVGMPFIARTDPDMFDGEGNMVRSKRYDFDDNDYEPPVAVADTEGEEKQDGTDKEGEEEASGPEETKQIPLKVALDAISLSHRIQTDLETTAMDFVKKLKDETGQKNLCLAGGVALNSVLNGRLSRELGFEKTFIPPYPGDDGIAVGCCAYGLFAKQQNNQAEDTNTDDDAATTPPKLWSEPLSPYQGPLYTEADILEAIAEAEPWLEVETVRDEDKRIEILVDEIASGGVVALFQGRSELGPRALGHRSILADPRKKGLVRFINEFVKKRESFRPFAPSALAEEAGDWFDLMGDEDGDNDGDDGASNVKSVDSNVSPYMSITAQVKESKRDLIPAVTHVDGSSRLQTVTPESDPHYHKLIKAFFKRTKVPMVLNTSFNTLKSEPIVETPQNAVRSFLSSMGTIEMLVMGDFVIRRKEADVRALLGEEQLDGQMTPPSKPRRAGPVHFETTFTTGEDDGEGGDDDDASSSSDPVTRVRMPDRPMHNDKDGGWFEVLDDLEAQLLGVCDGTVGVNEIMTHYTAMGEEGEQSFDKITDYDQVLFENIVRRLVRLYEHTLISW